MTLDDFTFRPLQPSDEPYLREALYVALWDSPDEPRRPRCVLEEPRIAALVAGWGRDGDVGLLAECRADSEPVGAVWIRTYSPPPIGKEFLEAQTPHLGIAVLADHQGRGIGTALMHRALTVARQKYLGVALSVHPRNPARRLYERLGFRSLGASNGGYLVMHFPFESPIESND